MISKYILPVFAIAAVFLLVAVPYTSAAGEDLIEKQINYEIDSEYADEHDRVVNVADASAITNPDTWATAPRGIWIGASTEESLFRFDTVMESENRLHIYSDVRFNSTQVMNGASTTIIRSPIASEGVTWMQLRIYQVSPDWDIQDPMFSEAYVDATTSILSATYDVDMTDVSITTGTDAWTVNGRTYIQLYGPIYSEIDYVFAWVAYYEPDTRPAIYLSGQDVANDNKTNTKVGIYSKQIPDQVTSQRFELAVDPGISYDMLEGLGNGLFAKSFYMYPGDSISMMVKSGSFGIDQNLWHTVMIPFVTADGNINATVAAYYKFGDNWVKAWQDTRTNWNGYILACSEVPIRLSSVRDIKIVVTLNHAERVNWMFIDSASESFSQSYIQNRADLIIDGYDHVVQARPYASYQLSVGQVFMPSLDPADFPPMVQPQVNQPGNYYGTILGVVMMVVGGVMVATGFLAPIGFLVGGAGAVMLTQDLMSGGRLFTNDGSGGFNIPGIFSDALDKIRNALKGIGEFVISIGQAFYDGVKWVVDAVGEYLPILLGLLIIAVALALFFGPIFVQLKLWGVAWRMAEGDVQAAAAQAQDLAGQASGIVSKFRRR